MIIAVLLPALSCSRSGMDQDRTRVYIPSQDSPAGWGSLFERSSYGGDTFPAGLVLLLLTLGKC